MYGLINIVIIAQLLALTSCVATLKNKVVKTSPYQVEGQFDPTNKFIRVRTKIDMPTHGKREAAYLNRLRNNFNDWALYEVERWRVFDNVQLHPSEVEEKLHPKRYDDDFSLTIVVTEKVLADTPKHFLRVVTFGGVPQEQLREISFDVEILERKTNKKVTIKKSVVSNLEGSMVIVFYPFNSFRHPFMASEESKMLIGMIAPDIRAAFGLKEK